MREDDGRVGKPTGLSQAEPQSSQGLGPTGFDPSRVGKERCPCGHPSCRYWFLTGIGQFVQGSGFREDEADLIISALSRAGGEA